MRPWLPGVVAAMVLLSGGSSAEPVYAYYLSTTERAVLLNPRGGNGSGSGTVFDPRTGVVEHTFSRVDGRVTAVAAHNYGALVFFGTDEGIVESWDTGSMARRRRFRGLKASIACIDVPQRGNDIAAADAIGNVIVWPGDLASARVRLVGDGTPATAIAIDSDNGILAVADETGVIRVHRWREDREMYRLRLDGTHATAMEFSGDGEKLLVGTEDGTVEFRQSEDGALLRSQLGHRGAVRAIAVAPIAGNVASVSADGDILLWSLSTYAQSGEMGGGPPLCDIQYSPNSEELMATGEDGTVRTYSVAGRFETGVLTVGE